jgi:hypothetical protein
MFDLVLAAVLLSAPKDTPVDPNWIEVLRPTILVTEVLDPRERSFLLTHDLVGDFEMIRGRHESLADCPQLGETQNWPDTKMVNTFLTLNRSFRNDLHKRLEIDVYNAEAIRDAITETDHLYQVWDTLRDAQCDYYYVSVRRQALRSLRSLIGDQAYYSGQMPPPMPLRHLPCR